MHEDIAPVLVHDNKPEFLVLVVELQLSGVALTRAFVQDDRLLLLLFLSDRWLVWVAL